MNRNESREKAINDVLRRNLYLESLLFGATEDKELNFEVKIVHVVIENVSNEIRGIFLDEHQANYVAAINDNPCSVVGWMVQASASEWVPPVIIPNGTKVSFQRSGKYGEGTVIDSDRDDSQGIMMVIYKILPKDLPFHSDSTIFAFHSEIMGVEGDSTKIK